MVNGEALKKLRTAVAAGDGNITSDALLPCLSSIGVAKALQVAGDYLRSVARRFGWEEPVELTLASTVDAAPPPSRPAPDSIAS